MTGFCAPRQLMHKLNVTVCPVMQLKKAGSAGTQEIQECVCVLSWETFCLSWKGGRSPGCLCLCFVWVLHTGAVESHTLFTLCAHPVSIPCVLCPCLCSALGCSALLLVERAHSKVAAASLSRGRDSRSPSWLQAGGSPGLEQAPITSHKPQSWSSGSLRNSLFIYSPSGFHINAGAVRQIPSMKEVIKYVWKHVWSIIAQI